MTVPLTLLGALSASLGFDTVASWFFTAGSTLLSWLWHVLEFFGSLDYAQWTQHRPAAWTLVCGAIGVTLLLAPRGWPGRYLGIIWFLPMIVIRPPGPGTGEVWFTLLDVGQGLSSVVRTENHLLVFDTGSRWSSRSDAGRNVVIPYLRANGLGRIDTLIVSHGDNDHAGGAASILATLAVERVLTGTPRVAGEPCRAGQTWRWDDVEFTMLNPDGEQSKHNDASCVLRVSSRNGAILLPADIEKTAERLLIEHQGKGLAADILIAPHHGSRTSSTVEFLEAVKPKYVVFAVGYRNRYRHPHPLVVDRYRAFGSELYDSASGGAYEFRLRAMGIDVSAYRETHHRYWFAENAP